MSLHKKTIVITGSSRGIGREIALKAAKDGANLVLVAKSVAENEKLPGTIYSVAEEVVALGGQALPLQLDVRNDDEVVATMKKAADHFGGIDILVNNASAINLTPTLQTPMKRFDLMLSVNARATFSCSQACIPYLKSAQNPHILNLAPPLNLDPKWFKDHVAYTLSKYGMSFCTLGMAAEFADEGIAVNSLWPRTTIATAAIKVHFPDQILQASRKPAIVADAAYYILTSNSRENTGNFYIDETVLRAHGVSDFDQYSLNPGAQLFPDLFL